MNAVVFTVGLEETTDRCVYTYKRFRDQVNETLLYERSTRTRSSPG